MYINCFSWPSAFFLSPPRRPCPPWPRRGSWRRVYLGVMAFIIDMDGNTASFSGQFGAGFYQLELVVMDGAKDVGGISTAVKIAANQISTKRYKITEDLPGDEIGDTFGLIIDITNDYQDSIEIRFYGNSSFLELYQDMDVTVYTSEEVDSYI